MPLPTIATPWSRKRRERLAELDVEGGIEILAQRQHDDRDLGLRIEDEEGHEHAVVEAALAVGRDGQARRLDEPLDLAPPAPDRPARDSSAYKCAGESRYSRRACPASG